MSGKIIEISGGNFLNKGAELMLQTVAHRFRQMADPPCLASEIKAFDQPKDYAHLGLRPIFPSRGLYPYPLSGAVLKSSKVRRAAQWSLERLLVSRLRQSTGLVRTCDCHAMIDISGYAFGDLFPLTKTQGMVDHVRNYERRGRPVILMPQMLGPFKKEKHRSAFRSLLDSVTCVYARDRFSYDAVAELIGDCDERLKRAPDLTIFSMFSDEPHPDAPQEKYGCIVPNEKVIKKAKSEWGDTYKNRLVAAGIEMAKQGIRPVVVMHSSEPGDLKLAREIEGELASEGAFLFRHHSPFVLKQFIAGSTLLVGSRFHAVVAALSTGVPAITLGWAHKYQAIMEDFKCASLQHTGADPADSLIESVKLLCDSKRSAGLRGIIIEQKNSMQASNNMMWEDVFEILNFKNKIKF